MGGVWGGVSLTLRGRVLTWFRSAVAKVRG